MPRPRIKDEAPLDLAEKQRRWRQAHARATGRRILRVALEPEDAARLAALEAASGESAAALIRRLIRQAG